MTTATKLAKGAGIAAATGVGLALFSQWQARRAEAAVPPDGEFIEVEGARLHYLDRGRGPAIVMIHGLSGQLRNFSYALLDRLTPDHRVILVDRPRSGHSTATNGSEPGIADQAAIVARLIDALGLEAPLLVGHSLGGAVALALALDHPGKARGLALLVPLTQPQTAVPKALRGLVARGRATRWLLSRVFGVPIGRLAQRWTVREVFAPEPVAPDFAVAGGGMLALRPDNIDAASFELSAADAEMTGLARRYGELRLPVDILFARQDHLLDPELHGRRTADAIPGARLELVDGGHMLPVTQPDRVGRFIRDAAGRARR